MTHIDQFLISGFKGIDEIKVDAGNINLITGRNNTGKTSLMEALDILFNPQNMARFEENIGKIINAHKRTCSITCHYSKSQTRLTDFVSDDPNIRQREVGIRPPRDEEIVNYFSKAISDVIETNERYPMPVIHPSLQEEQETLEESNDVEHLIFNTVQDSLSELSMADILLSAKNDLVIFEIEGDEYPFIYLGENYEAVRDRLVEQSTSRLRERASQFPESISTQLESLGFHQSIERLLTPRFGKGRFLDDEPSKLGGLYFVESVQATSDNIDLEDNNMAVRVSQIERYLKDNNIVDNLDDFSFDKLVFREEDEPPYEIPYSFMGDGLKTIVGVLWELYNDAQMGEILLLEEPENHMHPGYIENLVHQLVNISYEDDIQLFITTHNVDFIDSFFSDHVQKDHEEYLQNHFKLIQLTDRIDRTLDYERAKEKSDDLDLDLRGI